MAIYTVFHEESESEVKNAKCQAPEGKTYEKPTPKGKPRVVVRRVKKSRNFHDPLVGTDTTGPGEAVSAIGGANLEGIT